MKFAITLSINPFLKVGLKRYKQLEIDEQKTFLLEAICYPLEYEAKESKVLEVFFEPHQDGRQHLHGTIDCTYEELAELKKHIQKNYMMKNDKLDWILNVQEWYPLCWEKYIRKDQCKPKFPFAFTKKEYPDDQLNGLPHPA